MSVHKLLFLVNLPNFAKFLCDSCDQHSEISVILPDIEKSDLQKGIKNLYSYGSVSDLEELLGLKKERNHEIDEEMRIDEAFSGSNPITTENIGYVSVLEELCDVELKQEVDMEMSVNNDITEALLDDSVKDINQVSDISVELESGFGDDTKIEDDTNHSFEMLPSRMKGNISPGILCVDKRYKFRYKSECNGKFSFFCVSEKPVRCRARALVKRDDSTGKFSMIKCATDKVHNHTPVENKVNDIVKKMTKDMMDMIQVNIIKHISMKNLSKTKFFRLIYP